MLILLGLNFMRIQHLIIVKDKNKNKITKKLPNYLTLAAATHYIFSLKFQIMMQLVVYVWSTDKIYIIKNMENEEILLAAGNGFMDEKVYSARVLHQQKHGHVRGRRAGEYHDQG